MQNYKFFIFCHLIFICIALEDAEQHLDIQCQSTLFENIFTNIRIEYVKKIIPDNIEEVQIISLLEHLLCEKLNNQQDLSKNRFQGALPLRQLLNSQSKNVNQLENNNSICQIEYLLQSDQEEIDFILDLTYDNNDNCNGNLNLLAKVKFQIRYSIIRHIIVCALIVIFQINQINKNQNIQKEILDENETRIQIKVLSPPLLMQIILDNTFMVSIFNEIGAINSDKENFLIYVVPILFQAYIMLWLNWVNFVVIFESNFRNYLQNFDNDLLGSCISLGFVVSDIYSFIYFSIEYENNTIYQYCIPFIYFLQILYNFRFKKCYFDHSFFFAQLSTKVFYVLYLRGFPFNQRDVDQDLQMVYVVGGAFFFQFLFFYLQKRFGPKRLICLQRKKNVILKKQVIESECPICQLSLLEEISNQKFNIQKKNLTKTNCHHIFHTECLVSWFERNQTCPICRGQLTESILI